ETLFSLIAFYGKEDYRSKRLLNILNRACNTLKGKAANAPAAREVLQEALKWKALSSALTTTAVGHAHIDVGWMWPVKETIRKAARTFSSQLTLMERYPEYVFGASQPQLYKFVQDHYPQLFEKIRQRIKEGRWECQGAMWVECDCNVPSGESLIRQFLHGKNYYMDNFGVDVRHLWIPDVFGYAASLPQIIKKTGCSFFVTQKISWNRINHFPYSTFRWRGIDGSEVVTHFPPEDNYNSPLIAGILAGAQTRFEQNDQCEEFLTLFGIGDGGGGPKDEYIQRGILCRDLEGAPKVRFGTAQGFCDRVLADDTRKLPSWSGELYLENHRGTLTTQAHTKRNNRKLEQLMTTAEMICSLLPAAQYPHQEFDGIWKCILINQFHDIIPGSSIRKVYETTEAEHAQCIAQVGEIVKEAGKQLFTADENSLVLFNTLAYDYKRPVELPASWGTAAVADASGAAVVVQKESDGTLVAAVPVPAGCSVNLRKAAGAAAAVVQDNVLVLENDVVRYVFNEDGQVTSAIWLEDGRELLEAPGNVFGYYADRPTYYDAWDVDIWYKDQLIETAVAAAPATREVGPVRSVLNFQLKVGNSVISQKVTLAQGSASLEFSTKVHWDEAR
ncbi:MAG: alpha-mannosidase, partial [Victivallales bacterium]|nr:alpha-mannosidase [Victivallales bacterium]